MVSPDSVGVSRVPTYLGFPWTQFRCRLRAFHPLWTNFPDRSANFLDIVSGSRNPGRQAVRFGLLRVRSPLLAEYRLISFPAVTEMFHFTASRLLNLWIQFRIAEHYFCWIAPFGNSRINACMQLPATYRSFTRPSSPTGAKASFMRS